MWLPICMRPPNTSPGDTYNGITRYRAWDVRLDEIENPLDLQFGDTAVLRGYTIMDDMTVVLYWEALAVTDVEYSVLLHLETSPDAPPQYVLDHAIAGSIVSVTTWTPGIIYRDPIALPVDMTAGEYTLRVGLYVYQGDERLPICG